MNFFKSVFSDEPESEPGSETPPNFDSGQNSSAKEQPHNNAAPSTAWSLGGLMKTLTTKSESIIEIYQRDLKEFGSGLKKEIEVAHGSLETVGKAIDEISSSVVKGTAQIISHGKDAILTSDLESYASDNNNSYERTSISNQNSLNSKPYSRFDAQVRLIQGDSTTFCEDPEDLEDYKKWKLGFNLEEKREEFEGLIEENDAVQSLYKRVVPDSVDEESFWCRYFFKVFKLKQAEDVRANIVKRAISTEEEDLSWDVDDDEDDEPVSNEDLRSKDEKVSEETNSVGRGEVEKAFNEKKEEISADKSKGEKATSSGGSVEKVSEETNNAGHEEVEKASNEKAMNSGGNVVREKVDLQKNKEEIVSRSNEEEESKEKGNIGEASTDGGVTVVQNHSSMAEDEDLGWDEIEDISSIDDYKKPSDGGNPNKSDVRKLLSAAEEDEALSWDIEDDDDDSPRKS